MSEAIASLLGALIGAGAALSAVYLAEALRDRRKRRAVKRLLITEMNDNLIPAELLLKRMAWTPGHEGPLFKQAVWHAHSLDAAMLFRKEELWRPTYKSYDYANILESLNRMAQAEEAPPLVREFDQAAKITVERMIEATRTAITALGGEPHLTPTEMDELERRYGS